MAAAWLPSPLLAYTFAFVDPPTLLLAVPAVCKEWQRVCRLLVSEIEFDLLADSGCNYPYRPAPHESQMRNKRNGDRMLTVGSLSRAVSPPYHRVLKIHRISYANRPWHRGSQD